MNALFSKPSGAKSDPVGVKKAGTLSSKDTSSLDLLSDSDEESKAKQAKSNTTSGNDEFKKQLEEKEKEVALILRRYQI